MAPWSAGTHHRFGSDYPTQRTQSTCGGLRPQPKSSNGKPKEAAEKGDWLHNTSYLSSTQTTISCGACPLFQQPPKATVFPTSADAFGLPLNEMRAGRAHFDCLPYGEVDRFRNAS
jgi:hypothetical protein